MSTHMNPIKSNSQKTKYKPQEPALLKIKVNKKNKTIKSKNQKVSKDVT